MYKEIFYWKFCRFSKCFLNITIVTSYNQSMLLTFFEFLLCLRIKSIYRDVRTNHHKEALLLKKIWHNLFTFICITKSMLSFNSIIPLYFPSSFLLNPTICVFYLFVKCIPPPPLSPPLAGLSISLFFRWHNNVILACVICLTNNQFYPPLTPLPPLLTWWKGL